MSGTLMNRRLMRLLKIELRALKVRHRTHMKGAIYERCNKKSQRLAGIFILSDYFYALS